MELTLKQIKSMTIKDGLNLPANDAGRITIPNVGRRQLPEFFKQMGYKRGAEIGVQRGSFLHRLAAQGFEMYGVDPWKSYRDYHVNDKFTDKQEAIYQTAKDYLQKFPKCHLIRKTSMQAVEDFEEESLDFVYIDGHHGFKYVTEDIFEWTKRVRKGGIIAGHDYAYARKPSHYRKPYVLQVKFVIDAYVQAFDINPWYVLGAKHRTFEGERRDQFRSWFWFKTWDEPNVA